jgi:hypothetical protein
MSRMLAVGFVAAVVVVTLVIRARPKTPDAKPVATSQAGELWDLVRKMEPRGLEAPELQGTETQLVRVPLDEATAQRFFPVGGNVYDPHTYFHLLPGRDEMRPMKEYPGGAWRVRTNSLGLREDHDIAPTRSDVFVVVAGDSQTEGVCDDDASFANRLEALLKKDHPRESVEVLNTGCYGYSFYNYLGALEAWADRRPDAFVAAIFGGNDFMECLALYHLFHHTQSPPGNRDEWTRVSAMLEAGEAAQAQWLASTGYFSRFPDQVDCALRAALEVADEMKRRCREMGTELIIVYIPSVFDLNDGEGAEQIEQAKALLQLTGQDLTVGNRLGDRLVWALRERDIDVIDLRAHFHAEERPWYWPEYHINLHAHERIAELLLPRIEAHLKSH